MSEILIRPGQREDCKSIRALIQELADFEEMPSGPKIDHKTLERDGFDLDYPLFKSYVAVAEDKIIGYAILYYTYSTWEGKGMYLEDICVTEEFRQQGVGCKILQRVAKDAVENGCCRLDFIVLNWNPAQNFYRKMGAVDITVSEKWHNYRLPKEALHKLADSA